MGPYLIPGTLPLSTGDDATSVSLSDGCFDLSDNFVVVFRDDVDGGTVYNADGTDTSYVCIDGTSQVVSFISSGTTGPQFRLCCYRSGWKHPRTASGKYGGLCACRGR